MSICQQHRQRGLTAIELLIGSAVLLIIITAIVLPLRRDAELRERGRTLSTATAPYHAALFAYTLKFRKELTTGGTMTGVVTPTAPTCTELRALMPALLDYNCRLPERGGTPTFELTVVPTGCSGTACDVRYAITSGAPIGDDEDGSRIVQAAVAHFGAEAGHSLVGFGSVIRGTGWTRNNPLGNVPRTFGTLSTLNSSMYSNFVTLYDIRDPHFLGGVTINQYLTVTGTITSVTGVGVGNGGCQYAELTSTGQVIARSPACIVRVVADGASGTVETRGPTGSTTIRIGDTIQVFNSAGTDAAGVRYVAGATEVYADRFRNNTGTAGINPDGTVFGTTASFANATVTGITTVGQFTLRDAQVAGQVCPANSFARDAAGRWMECFGGVWRYVGIQIANAGDACIAGAGYAQTPGSPTQPLICRNNTYISLNQALGLVAIWDSLSVVNGTVVPAPACEAPATPILMTDMTRFQTPAAGGITRIGYTGSGPWTMQLEGAGGGEAVVWRGCRYPSF